MKHEFSKCVYCILTLVASIYYKWLSSGLLRNFSSTFLSYFFPQMLSWISNNVLFQRQSLKLWSKRRKFQAGQWECFYLICYKSGSSCEWKCNASCAIIMPVGGLIRTADSQAMQQQALDILNGPDIIALTFHFLYPFQKIKWWMGYLDGLELFKFGVLYHRPISTSFNVRLSHETQWRLKSRWELPLC